MIETPIILSNLREVYISEICVPLSIFKCTRAPHLHYASFSLVCSFDHHDFHEIIEEIYEFAAFGSYATDTEEPTEFHLGITESKDYQVMNYTQATGNSDTPFKTLSFRFNELNSDDFWSNVPPIEPVSSLSLHFEYNADVSDQVLEYITSLSESDAITTLELPYNVLLGHELMGDLACFPNLKELIFRSFPRRTETAIQLSVWLKLREARQLPRLQELNIEGWDKGIDSGISNLLRNEVDSLTTSRSDRSIEISLSRNFGEFD
ncbi:hypothetical protein ONZ45_g15686 [Pleurotus djamor]|nr:hypothetical protein ONZ45_g15686 [Pleurotus djamor]